MLRPCPQLGIACEGGDEGKRGLWLVMGVLRRRSQLSTAGEGSNA